MEANIRRQKYTLYFSGLAVLFFGAWGVLKLLVKLYYDPIELDSSVLEATDDPTLIFLVFFIIYASIIALDSAMRIYIGVSAIKEGKGKRKRPIYLVVTVIYLIASIYTTYSTMYDLFKGDVFTADPDLFEQTFTTTVIDFTCNLTFVLILIASLKLRHLTKKYTDPGPEVRKPAAKYN